MLRQSENNAETRRYLLIVFLELRFRVDVTKIRAWCVSRYLARKDTAHIYTVNSFRMHSYTSLSPRVTYPYSAEKEKGKRNKEGRIFKSEERGQASW